MDRLTRRHLNGSLFKPPYLTDTHVGYVKTDDILQRLADYNDTNLAPTQIREIDNLYAEKCKEVSKLEVYKNGINFLLNKEDVEMRLRKANISNLKDE